MNKILREKKEEDIIREVIVSTKQMYFLLLHQSGVEFHRTFKIVLSEKRNLQKVSTINSIEENIYIEQNLCA